MPASGRREQGGARRHRAFRRRPARRCPKAACPAPALPLAAQRDRGGHGDVLIEPVASGGQENGSTSVGRHIAHRTLNDGRCVVLARYVGLIGWLGDHDRRDDQLPVGVKDRLEAFQWIGQSAGLGAKHQRHGSHTRRKPAQDKSLLNVFAHRQSLLRPISRELTSAFYFDFWLCASEPHLSDPAAGLSIAVSARWTQSRPPAGRFRTAAVT